MHFDGVMLMKLVFFLEEESMKELLDGILPKILPDNITFKTIPHEGKYDLEKSFPRNYVFGMNLTHHLLLFTIRIPMIASH